MIRVEHYGDIPLFLLQTHTTTYAFSVHPSGHLEHLYYGRRLNHLDGLLVSQENRQAFAPGNTIAYSPEWPSLTLETFAQEVSTLGKGDLREPLVETIDAQGRKTLDFKYKGYRLMDGIGAYEHLDHAACMPLPHIGNEPEIQTLEVELEDTVQNLTLFLYYTPFEQSNVIGRRCRLINRSHQEITVHKLMSNQLDLGHKQWQITQFTGAWAREMEKSQVSLPGGVHQIGSSLGTSSNRTNPFFMVHQENTSESHGPCYGFNLIYSGNWLATIQAGAFGSTRVLQGVRPDAIAQQIASGSALEVPMAVMSYSHEGFSELSNNMHTFVKDHIVRGPWQYRSRPVLINSWEAFYFNFSEHQLLQLARRAKHLGCELFVLDDGWFGRRDSDQTSLGDWTVHPKKFPKGLKPLVDKITDLGMDFGIWFEPEMVNPQSDLFKNHPDWALSIPGTPQSLGRNQMILDLSEPLVQEYLFEAISKILSSAKITYVKWDMNRVMSDVYAPLSAATWEGQAGLAHRYILGLYKLLDRLTNAFPHVLFEGCASGGNRFDLGMLSYMPQIWASDNTDAYSRIAIQEGYSYGYPLSTLGAHVSDIPNHQTLRRVPLATRQGVASFGLLGYELNLAHQSKDELKAIQAHISYYKDWRQVFQFGHFYRLSPKEYPELKNSQAWMVINQDKTRGVIAVMQGLVEANQPDLRLPFKGLDPKASYRIYNQPHVHQLEVFGDLVNAVSPIALPKHSLRYQIANKLYPIQGEILDVVVSGEILLSAGIRLPQGFCGMGYNDQVRLYQDFAMRLYSIEKIEV